jgi:hypothetical protein
MTPEESGRARREYQRRYYAAHKDKARIYQHHYNQTHKKKARPAAPRRVVRTTFTRSDIMHLPFGGGTERILNDIVQGRKSLTA